MDTGLSWRHTLAGVAALLLAMPAWADEAAVRDATRRCEAAWNTHEPNNFGACLTADVWFSEADDSHYQRFRGRDKVLGMFDYNIRNTDLQWQVVRTKMLPDGTVAVQMNQRAGILPKTDGRYAMVFDSNPSLARWRHEDGTWKLYFFTSDVRWARVLIDELKFE